MGVLVLLLLVAALVLFVIDTVRTRFGLVSAGLACLSGAFLVMYLAGGMQL